MTNRRCLWALAWLCCIGAQVLHAADADYCKAPGPLTVSSISLDWKDAKRDRTMPVRIYYPSTLQGKFPVIIFSHGLGGSRDGYAYLGENWAGFGYVCVHLQHVGSDNSVWRGLPPSEVMPALRKAIQTPENVLNRPKDVSFAIDQLVKLNKDDSLFKGHLDVDHIGVAGHSFGAFTTLAVAGEVFVTPGGKTLAMPDPRVKAAIAMSEAPPRDPTQYDRAFAKIAIPCMHMTGTLDDSPIGDTKAADRRVPFDHIPKVADQYLVILQGGDHMVFSGRGRLNESLPEAGNPQTDRMFQILIQQSTTAFWDAYLKSDQKAKTWITDGGCKTMLGKNATLEMKPAKGH